MWQADRQWPCRRSFGKRQTEFRADWDREPGLTRQRLGGDERSHRFRLIPTRQSASLRLFQTQSGDFTDDVAAVWSRGLQVPRTDPLCDAMGS